MASDSRTGFPISPGSRPGHLSSRDILGRRIEAVKPPLTKRRPPRSLAAWRTRQGSMQRSQAASVAADLIRSAYAGEIGARAKADGSPVTDADLAAEAAIRAIVEARFPEDGFYGEESAATRMDAEHVWIVDPIDGTKSFVRRYPMFSTQIAVMRRGRIDLGVSSAPVYGEIAWAERGAGAHLGGAPLAVSRIAALEQATLSTGNLRSLAAGRAGRRSGASSCASIASEASEISCTITCSRPARSTPCSSPTSMSRISRRLASSLNKRAAA
jgi:fructose-1,6-bisphosphatase/inositol monophosphatase family enzyme